MNDYVDPKRFYEVKQAISQRLKMGPHDLGLKLKREDLDVLLAGHAPSEKLPESYCEFDASYVPILRHADDGDSPMMSPAGITVSPHPAGGVVLCTTDGRLMIMAYDKTGRVSGGGMRLVMPQHARDACNKRQAIAYADQGSTAMQPLPAWAQPSRVYSIGASLMVLPAEQPPIIKEGDDGVILWGGIIETSRPWRDDDCRRIDPVKWWLAVRALHYDPDETAGAMAWAVSSKMMIKLSKALAAGDDFWAVSPDPRGFCWVYRPCTRGDLFVVLARAKLDDPLASIDWVWQAAAAMPHDEPVDGRL